MRVALRFVLALLFIVTGTPIAGGQGVKPPDPILILVSFDAWRWDLIDRAPVPNLRALAARGVRAEGLMPPFPSKTFPSHYTIVTGLYPANHGIISNSIRDDAIGERFTMSAPTARDSRWWSGEPLWATTVKQGRRAASMFWPGSEVEIGGVRPSEYRPFDDAFPNSGRVKQVLTWLSLPEGQRPSFITVYFSDVDTASHSYGPESAETLAAAARLDAVLGELVAGVDARGLTDRTNIVIVSDHGISPQSPERRIVLDDYVDLATVNIVDWSPVLHIAPRTGTVAELYDKLRDKHPALAVYRREDLPAHLRYSGNPRIQPIIALAADGWTITSRERFDRDQKEQRFSKGDHGYDGRYRSMHGLFVAAGPMVRRGMVVPAFENVHLYELMCRMLGLKPAKNDGDPSVTRGFLTGSQVLGSSGSQVLRVR